MSSNQLTINYVPYKSQTDASIQYVFNQAQAPSTFQRENYASSNNATSQIYSSYQPCIASNTSYRPIHNHIQQQQQQLDVNNTSNNRFSDLFEPIDLDSLWKTYANVPNVFKSAQPAAQLQENIQMPRIVSTQSAQSNPLNVVAAKRTPLSYIHVSSQQSYVKTQPWSIPKPSSFQSHPVQLQQSHPVQLQQSHPVQLQQSHPVQIQQFPTQLAKNFPNIKKSDPIQSVQSMPTSIKAGPSVTTTSPSSSTPISATLVKSIENRLKPIFKSSTKENPSIYDEIEAGFAESLRSIREFVHALVRCMFRSTFHLIDSARLFDISLFDKRMPILALFVENSYQLEKEALIALKTVIQEDQLSSDFACIFYDLFYKSKSVKLSVFNSVLTKQEMQLFIIKSQPIVLNSGTYKRGRSEKDDDDLSGQNKTKMRKLDSSEEKDNSETTCPICLETLTEVKRRKQRLMSTRCGHVICKSCVSSLFKLKEKKSKQLKSVGCPVCRKTTHYVHIHDLFL